ncbi:MULTISPECIES: efflux RND transporter permease subunit [unclassified Aureimonas]|uniref:efflux RND transporter permease subunit n=1 Tax=unclassified Aureimonas TaxID=2615206 RepID=UPI0006FFE0AE|nr:MULTISPECIES: efflux RND transporter permease subunit [unclassified Aureimonas]KQT52782.1 ABC transporter permease [Aureimonas sp. Leaf427]KQT80241.1 ABC transporter permease [Aureimonas sp. Leaf460]
MNGISAWSIRNPIPTIVLFLTLAFTGLWGFGQLRVNTMPDIDFPMVTVTVVQTGASPTEIETQVTDLVENAVQTLSGVESVTSTISEGASTTAIEFTLDMDLMQATDDVRNAVDSIASDLPDAAETPLVARVDAGDFAILTYVVDAPALSPDDLSWKIDNDVAKALLAVDGVSKITRSGGVSRAILVKLDPDRLNALGVTVGDISRALAAQNVNQSGGRTVVGAAEQSVRTLGRVDSIEALRETPIAITGGQSMRLADFGEIVDGWEEPRSRARLDGREVVAFSVYSAKGSSEIAVTNAVRAAIGTLDAADAGASYAEVTSSSTFVQESYDAAFEALWLGAVLAIVVVFLFLRDIRATLVAATALPLSLIPTFAVMAWLDLSLNTITLLALSLVVGILVDDAIVEIENIVRHMRRSGKSAYEAAIEAADEIGLAVVATTMTIVAVFVPVAFMPGIPGKLFVSFAIAVCVSVLFSLLVARTLTPLMGAYFVKASGADSHDDTPGWVFLYLRILRQALRFRWITVLLGIAFFAGSVFLATKLPTEFMPASDQGRSIVSVALQPGSTLAETDAVTKAVSAKLKSQPEVASVFASIGATTEGGMGPVRMGAGASVVTATVTANLKPREERTVSQQDFEARSVHLFDDIPGARIQFGADGQSGSKVEITLVGENSELLTATAAELAAGMRGIAGLSNPISDAATAKPELVITPDKAKMASVGVTSAEIASLLNIATLGDADRALAKYNLGDRQIYVIPTLSDAARGDLSILSSLSVRGSVATVPLGSIADFSFGAGPTSINHVDGERTVSVEAELNGLTLGEARAAIEALPVMKTLPAGIHERTQGDAKRMAELFSGFTTAIAVGILLMFGTLVLLFNSFLQPVTILTALPLSIGGAFGFLYVTGASIAVSVLIGVLLLMGIAAKNSILLVEYAILARRSGTDRHTALIEAATKRARPIVMTSIAMAAGMAPIALGIGADAESRAPMAIAVIGGLLSSTVLSLVYVPAVYTVVDDIERVLGRWLKKLLPREARAVAEPAE